MAERFLSSKSLHMAQEDKQVHWNTTKFMHVMSIVSRHHWTNTSWNTHFFAYELNYLNQLRILRVPISSFSFSLGPRCPPWISDLMDGDHTLSHGWGYPDLHLLLNLWMIHRPVKHELDGSQHAHTHSNNNMKDDGRRKHRTGQGHLVTNQLTRTWLTPLSTTTNNVFKTNNNLLCVLVR